MRLELRPRESQGGWGWKGPRGGLPGRGEGQRMLGLTPSPLAEPCCRGSSVLGVILSFFPFGLTNPGPHGAFRRAARGPEAA